MTDTPKKQRGRPRKNPAPAEAPPPQTEDPNQAPSRGKLIPAPPDVPAMHPDMMNWIFDHLPRQMARDFYGGIDRIHIPKS